MGSLRSDGMKRKIPRNNNTSTIRVNTSWSCQIIRKRGVLTWNNAVAPEWALILFAHGLECKLGELGGLPCWATVEGQGEPNTASLPTMWIVQMKITERWCPSCVMPSTVFLPERHCLETMMLHDVMFFNVATLPFDLWPWTHPRYG